MLANLIQLNLNKNNFSYISSTLSYNMFRLMQTLSNVKKWTGCMKIKTILKYKRIPRMSKKSPE